MRGRYQDKWGQSRGYRGGKNPPLPPPTTHEFSVLTSMHREGKTQTSIAEELGVPRTRIRIWMKRIGLVGHYTRPHPTAAIIAPLGHVVSRHRDIAAAIGFLERNLRGTGCRVVEL